MRTLKEILEQAKRLSPSERHTLIEELEQLEPVTNGAAEPNQGPYSSLLDLAGAVHSEHRDVAGDKYKHLADAYTDKR